MKTTQQKTLNAFTALNRIRNKVRGSDALALFHLKNQLKENFDFFAEEQIRMAEEHKGIIAENGMILIADQEEKRKFDMEMAELLKMEIDVKADIPAISLERNPEIDMEDIEQLAEFVNFK